LLGSDPLSMIEVTERCPIGVSPALFGGVLRLVQWRITGEQRSASIARSARRPRCGVRSERAPR
jgi:hypothetical protein